MKKIAALVIITICFSSCFNNYFKVKTDTTWKEDHLQAQDSDKKIVVHFRNSMKVLANPVFGPEQINGRLETYYAMADRYMNPNTEERKNFKYKYKYRKELFSEIHVYVNENYSDQNEYIINSTNFVKSNIYNPNKGLSIASHVLGVTIIVGVLVGIGGLAVVGMATTLGNSLAALNCPQAYLETSPGHYQFIGGLFTGAVRQDLQRTDMIRLPVFSVTPDTIRIRIKGMHDETQFIDHVSLKEVIHPEGTEVVGTHHGDLFTIRHLKMPNEVKAGEMVDRSKTLLFRDGQSYGFHITDSLYSSHIQLKFSRKEGDKKAVLVARMKNSAWSGFIHNQLQTTDTSPKVIEAGYHSSMITSAMKISLMTKNGWKNVDHFPPAGNTATRDMAMEIDLSNVEGNDVLVKMEAPYRYWDVDHVGLSFETIRSTNSTHLCAVTTLKNGNSVSNEIDSDDGKYLELGSNDQLELEYTKANRANTPGSKSSYVLVVGGYYHQKSQSKKPQVTQPLRLSEPFSLNHYSIAKFKELGLEY